MSSKKNAIAPTRSENFSEWYQAVIKAADLAEHSAVRGCMIIKPWGYAIWELIQKNLDKMIKDTGHDNVYFPMLIPLSYLQKEAAHVDGFAKECAVVTHYRLETNDAGELVPAPDAKLSEPYIIRPTSETVIGTAMASWINSYKDLPVKINQWANVMRWEMRTRLFLRTSEFLWQEGHTAHATEEEAMSETRMMLDVYETLAQDYLAIPVIKGEKTPSERFPGAVNTYCIEAMMQDGKALQAGTSHFLGQNFSSAYSIAFADKNQQRSFAWTTSWGVSTRLIGALILTHSDDDGLVLPPVVAPVQVILIPVAMNADDLSSVMEYCEVLVKDLRAQKYHDDFVRVSIDKTDERAGTKFWNAVKKGIPLRVEIGMREINADLLSISRRDNPAKEKKQMKRADVVSDVAVLLNEIQDALLKRATAFKAQHTFHVNTLDELEKAFGDDEAHCCGFATAYFDFAVENNPATEEKLKKMKLTIRCMPLDRDATTGHCIFSDNVVNTKVIFARAY